MKPLSRAELRAALVPREPEDHKGVFGHVLIAAGSRGMAGAAILAAKAALRSGAGLVTTAVPVGIQATVAGAVPEAMTLGLPEGSSGALRPEGVGKLKAARKEKDFTVLALGPGLSQSADAAGFVLLALSGLDLPAVVDADALNLLAAQEGSAVRLMLQRRPHPCVYTPHPGEMARCLGVSTREVQKDRQAAAERLAKDWGGVALLKGHKTVISDGTRTTVNTTGGPGLAKGGSGDVLTGLLAGLWAQRLASGRGEGTPAFTSAALAAWLHGKAGELAEDDLDARAMTALDLLAFLPKAFKLL